MNQTVLDINSKIQLRIGKKDIQNMVILFNDIRNAFSSFIKNNLDSYYLSLVPIDGIPNMTRKCSKLFHSIYYFSFIIQGVVNVIGAIPINNKITTYMEILLSTFANVIKFLLIILVYYYTIKKSYPII